MSIDLPEARGLPLPASPAADTHDYDSWEELWTDDAITGCRPAATPRPTRPTTSRCCSTTVRASALGCAS